MKKLLLTLLLLLSLGFAASAATYTYEWTISSSDKAQTGKEDITLSLGGVDWTGKNLTNGKTPFSQRNGSTSIIFGSSSNSFKELDLEASAPFVGKKIESVSVTAYNGKAATSAVTVYVNGTAIGDAQALTSSKATYDFSSSEVLNEGNTLKIVIANSNTDNVSGNTLNLSGIKVVYADAETIEPEKITLEESNLVIKAGEQVIEGEEVELDANTTLTFSYNTDNANADITYSYSTDATNYTEGNSYTFDGNDVTLLVKAASENEVEKMLTVTKKYPTECPTPEFSVANGAEVYAGQVITVKADGAESLHLTANDVDVDGTSYTVVGNPGDEITLYALASVTGKNGDITADATITVKVVEATEATFNFIAKTYGLKVISDNNDGYETSVSEITEGIANMSFTGNYRLWKTTDNNQLRVMSGATFTISVPDGYYIESIDFDGSVSKATSNVGSIISKVWSYSGKVSAVKFTCSGRVDINTVTVKYAKLVPTLALSRVEITHGKVAGVVTVDYTFEIANHNGNPVDVTAAINGMDHIVFEKVETPAAAPARAAGENAVISGTLKATHADLKGAPSLNINVKATLDGKDLYNENHTEYATTGIEDVTVEGGEAAEYFNLQGIRVAEPQAGQVYIVRRGAKTTKELVK